MYINKVSIKNFRCFKDLDINFETPIVIISGDNGAGKTSILEAIHYMCYMKSFRTSSPKDLINFEVSSECEGDCASVSDNFFVKANFQTQNNLENELQVGFSQNKRLVKLNKKNVSSFKELMDFYRIVTLTEDDLLLIKGGPEIRRDFLDHAILLLDYTFLGKLREFKKVLQNRNMCLQNNNISKDLYDLWTEQLWEKSIIIQKLRHDIVKEYETQINGILQDIFAKETGKGSEKENGQEARQETGLDDKISVCLEYKPKKIDLGDSFDEFIAKNSDLMHQELCFRRSLFGAHLDDFLIKFKSKKSKAYASRGQQKLIVLMLKVAQLVHLGGKRGPATFLLDDFMTDFDEKRGLILANFLVSLKIQLIFTTPAKGSFFEDLLVGMGASIVKLTP